MPSSDIPRYYCCSNLFIDFISRDETNGPIVNTVLEEAEAERYEVVTSVASMTEVAFGAEEFSARELSNATRDAIDALWDPPSPVRLMEFGVVHAKAARELIREAMRRGWSLKPLDAIHLVTAQMVGAQRCYTFDGGLNKYGELLGMYVGPPIIDQADLDLQPPRRSAAD